MSRIISFTVSDENYERILIKAKKKGLTPSQFSKSSVFSYLEKYAVNGRKVGSDTKHQK